jgi:hypothetical protein
LTDRLSSKGSVNFSCYLCRERGATEVEESTVMFRNLNSWVCKKAVGFPMNRKNNSLTNSQCNLPHVLAKVFPRSSLNPLFIMKRWSESRQSLLWIDKARAKDKRYKKANIKLKVSLNPPPALPSRFFFSSSSKRWPHTARETIEKGWQISTWYKRESETVARYDTSTSKSCKSSTSGVCSSPGAEMCVGATYDTEQILAVWVQPQLSWVLKAYAGHQRFVSQRWWHDIFVCVLCMQG